MPCCIRLQACNKTIHLGDSLWIYPPSLRIRPLHNSQWLSQGRLRLSWRQYSIDNEITLDSVWIEFRVFSISGQSFTIFCMTAVIITSHCLLTITLANQEHSRLFRMVGGPGIAYSGLIIVDWALKQPVAILTSAQPSNLLETWWWNTYHLGIW